MGFADCRVVMRRLAYIVYCFLFFFVFVCVSIMPSRKSTNFGRRYVVDGFSERDEIWQIDRGVLLFVIILIGKLWHRGSPWGAKTLKGVNNFVTLFSYIFSERD